MSCPDLFMKTPAIFQSAQHSEMGNKIHDFPLDLIPFKNNDGPESSVMVHRLNIQTEVRAYYVSIHL